MQLLRDNLTLWTSDNAVCVPIETSTCIDSVMGGVENLVTHNPVKLFQEEGGDEIKEAASKPEGEGH